MEHGHLCLWFSLISIVVLVYQRVCVAIYLRNLLLSFGGSGDDCKAISKLASDPKFNRCFSYTHTGFSLPCLSDVEIQFNMKMPHANVQMHPNCGDFPPCSRLGSLRNNFGPSWFTKVFLVEGTPVSTILLGTVFRPKTRRSPKNSTGSPFL